LEGKEKRKEEEGRRTKVSFSTSLGGNLPFALVPTGFPATKEGRSLPSVGSIGQDERSPAVTESIESLLDPTEDFHGVDEEVIWELETDALCWWHDAS